MQPGPRSRLHFPWAARAEELFTTFSEVQQLGKHCSILHYRPRQEAPPAHAGTPAPESYWQQNPLHRLNNLCQQASSARCHSQGCQESPKRAKASSHTVVNGTELLWLPCHPVLLLTQPGPSALCSLMLTSLQNPAQNPSSGQ